MDIAHDEMILMHALNALDVKDDPARVATPDEYLNAKDDDRRRWCDLSEQEQRRTVQHYLKCHVLNGQDWLSDLSTDIDMDRLLQNFANGDDAENGRLIRDLFMKIGNHIEEDRSYVL